MEVVVPFRWTVRRPTAAIVALVLLALLARHRLAQIDVVWFQPSMGGVRAADADVILRCGRGWRSGHIRFTFQ
jgi:hypothetical protein